MSPNASRTTHEAFFAHREPQKTHRVPQKPVLRTEYPFRTRNACFLHRMLLKMRRVPQEAFLNTECSFRTVEACFWYGALPKTRRTWLSGAQASCCRCGTSNFTKERRRLISDYWSLSSWMDSTPRRGCSPLRSQKSRRFCRIAKSPTSFDPASITPG